MRNAARRPTSASIDLGEAISPLAVAGFLGAFLLGTKNPVSACTPSEVTATLAAAAIRREVASLRMAAAARVAVTSEGGHAGTGFLVPNKKAPRNPATASGEMASPRSMLADVGRLAAFLTPHRSPPAPGALWGHAPPTWRPGGACRRPNHARFGPWLSQRPRAGPGLCLTCAATYDPPAPPRWAWAVPTPPVALWGHGSGVGHANVPQGARNSLFLQIRLG